MWPAQELARKWAALLHQRKVRSQANNPNRPLVLSRAKARRRRPHRENLAVEAVAETVEEHVGGNKVDNQDGEILSEAAEAPVALVELPGVDMEAAVVAEVVAEVAAEVAVVAAAVEPIKAAAELPTTLTATGTTPASQNRSRNPIRPA